jgi:hypothetical protein
MTKNSQTLKTVGPSVQRPKAYLEIAQATCEPQKAAKSPLMLTITTENSKVRKISIKDFLLN